MTSAGSLSIALVGTIAIEMRIFGLSGLNASSTPKMADLRDGVRHSGPQVAEKAS